MGEVQRTGKLVPEFMKDDLEDKFKKHKKESYKNKASHINAVVDNLLDSEEYKEFRKYILKDNNKPLEPLKTRYIRDYNITKYLRDNKPPESDKFFILTLYLRYDINKAESIILDQYPKQFTYFDLLRNAWDIYHYDSYSKGVLKSKLWLSKSHTTNEYLDFCLLSSSIEASVTGRARLIGDKSTKTLVLTSNPDQEIYISICISLPKKSGKKLSSSWLLHAGGVFGGIRFPKLVDFILVKNNHYDSRTKFFNSGYENPQYKEKNRSLFSNETNVEDLENEIVLHLNRFRDFDVKPFLPDTKEELRIHNDAFIESQVREGYLKIKNQFTKEGNDDFGWYSISRVLPEKDEIALFSWMFSFENERQKVVATRSRMNRPDVSVYIGEVTLYEGHLYIEFREYLNKKRLGRKKSFTAEYPRVKNVDVFLGISSTITDADKGFESSTIAVREILFYTEKSFVKELKFIRGTIDDDNFEKFKGLSDDKKRYIGNRDSSTLAYPLPNNNKKLYYRLKQTSHLEGRYFCIFPDSSVGPLFSLCPLEIDRFSNVSMSHFDLGTDAELEFQGTIQKVSDIHFITIEFLTGNFSEQKIAHFYFEKVFMSYLGGYYWTGNLIIDSQTEYRPFAILHCSLLESFDFSPKFLMKQENEGLYDVLIKDLTKSNMIKYLETVLDLS